MVKCLTCGKFVGARGGARCTNCRNGDPVTSNKKTKNDGGPSRPSPSCSYEDATDGSGAEQISPKDNLPPEVNIARELRMLRSELGDKIDDLRCEVKEYREEIGAVRHAIETCNQRLDSLEDRLNALETYRASPDGVVELQNTVEQLKIEINDREQELLSADLEIGNLPEDKGENIVHTIELVAKKLGVALGASDIVFAERVGPRTDRSGGAAEPQEAARGRRVVVRLARRHLRDEMLRGARVRRGATSADLGLPGPPRRFYVNERLTKANKLLFYRVRQASAEHGWRYTWTKHGRILARRGDGQRTYNIRTEADLRRVFSGVAAENKVD